MSGRSWFGNAKFASPGLVLGAFGFVTTNIGTDPSTSAIFGAGGLTGTDAAGGVANSGPSFIASVTKTANNGEFLVTMADGYRAIWFAQATLWSATAGPNDGKTAGVCLPANQGSGRTTAVTFLVTTLDASNVPVETTGRTVNVFLVAKDSAVG